MGAPCLVAVSGKQYAGKDQLADWLMATLPQRFGVAVVKTPIALAIKQLYAQQNNLSLNDLEAHKARHRSGLIALGNWGREQSPDFWLEQILVGAKRFEGLTIVSDMRLSREYERLKATGALLIRVEADRAVRQMRAESLGGTLTNETDATECALDAVEQWDAVILNNGTLHDLAVACEVKVLPLLQARFSLQ